MGGIETLSSHANSGPKDHINIRILKTMVSGTPLYWDLEPECQILTFMWTFGPLAKDVGVDLIREETFGLASRVESRVAWF